MHVHIVSSIIEGILKVFKKYFEVQVTHSPSRYVELGKMLTTWAASNRSPVHQGKGAICCKKDQGQHPPESQKLGDESGPGEEVPFRLASPNITEARYCQNMQGRSSWYNCEKRVVKKPIKEQGKLPGPCPVVQKEEVANMAVSTQSRVQRVSW